MQKRVQTGLGCFWRLVNKLQQTVTSGDRNLTALSEQKMMVANGDCIYRDGYPSFCLDVCTVTENPLHTLNFGCECPHQSERDIDRHDIRDLRPAVTETWVMKMHLRRAFFTHLNPFGPKHGPSATAQNPLHWSLTSRNHNQNYARDMSR